MRSQAHIWTEAEKLAVERLWVEHASFTQIADAIATPAFTPTRSMIAGLVHRLKRAKRIKPRETPEPPQLKRARVYPKRRKVVAMLQPRLIAAKSVAVRSPVLDRTPVPEPTPRLIPLDKLKRGDCKWPIGDPKQPGFGFCGANRDGPLPYCRYHALLAYQPRETRRRRKAAA